MKQQFKIKALVLALAAAGASAPAFAGETIEFGDGYKFDWRLNTSYTIGRRMEAADPLLAGRNPLPLAPAPKADGKNDGENNFDKGALTANRAAALLDLKLSKGETGLVFSGSAFYDHVYHQTNDNNNAAGNPWNVNKPAPYNEFTDQAKKYHGGYARVLDAYGYTSFNLGDVRTSVRAGQFVVSWGESLFFPGISLAQGPADGTKQGIPGTETKDQLLPEQQISFTFEMSPQWSLLAHYQFGFHETLAPAPGSFLNTSDGVGPGGVCLAPYTVFGGIPAFGVPAYSGCSFGKRLGDITPSKTGQWGVGTRYRVTDETELGLYYLDYKDRTPLPEINAFAPGPYATSPVTSLRQLGGGTYRVRYFDDIQLIGGSFSTRVGSVALAGELSHKKGAPTLVNTALLGATGYSFIPNPTRADITQLNLNAFANLGRVPGMDGLLILGEIAGVTVRNVKKIRAPGAEQTVPAGFLDFVAPATDAQTFGPGGLAIQGTVIPSYTNVFEGWDLDLPVSGAYQMRGRTLLGGVGGQGDIRLSFGATMTYNRNLQVGVTYLAYFGSASLGKTPSATGAYLANERLLTDRDQLSMTVKYSF